MAGNMGIQLTVLAVNSYEDVLQIADGMIQRRGLCGHGMQQWMFVEELRPGLSERSVAHAL